MRKLNGNHLAGLAFLATVFFLSVIKIEDTDAWMHLSLGRLIWQTKGLPALESFVYTATDLPFLYSSWLFGVAYYLAYQTLNVYGVILLKATVVTAGFAVLFRDALRPYRNAVISIVVLSVIVMMTRHRFVERPDTFLMLFLSFSVFSINALVYDNKKYIYLLPLTHLLWANSHSSIVLMFIPFLAFLVGGSLQLHLSKDRSFFFGTPSSSHLKTILAVFAASFAASLISPYFFSQYLFGSGVMSTPFFKQEIIELSAAKWQVTKWPFVMAGAVIVSFLINRKRFSLPDLLLVLPFVILPFTAMRFIFLQGVIAGPVIARNLSSAFQGRSPWLSLSKKPVAAALALWIAVYTIGTYTNVFRCMDSEPTPGFGFSHAAVPEDALQYMDRAGIEGRIFNVFHWGGYIAWRDGSRRPIFIDPRGNIPYDLLEKSLTILNDRKVLDELDAKYDFQAILTLFPNTSLSRDFDGYPALWDNNDWALVYWDDRALLFVKTNDKYAAVARRDQYRYALPYKRISRARLNDPEYCAKAIGEFKRNLRETGSVTAHLSLGYIYNETGRYQEAVHEYEASLSNRSADKLIVYTGMAYALNHLGSVEESISYYRKALDIREDGTTMYNIGTSYLQQGDKKKALSWLRKAMALNPDLTSIYPLVSKLYTDLGMSDELESLNEEYKKAVGVNEGKEHFKKGMDAYFQKKYKEAIEEFTAAVKIDPFNPVLYSNLGYAYYDSGDPEKAFEYQKKALDLDPQFANAHYGVALLYKKLGNAAAAKEHWKEYLRIEPSGYFSRKAVTEISSMGGQKE